MHLKILPFCSSFDQLIMSALAVLIPDIPALKSPQWWLSERLCYLHCINTEDITVMHWAIDIIPNDDMATNVYKILTGISV